MVLMDVKGAFNGVRPEKLYRSMVETGVPGHVAAWAANMCRGRLAFLRRGQDKGNPLEVDNGILQRSPASPVLFAILLTSIF